MEDEIYQYLKKYGFSIQTLKMIENRNRRIFFTNLDMIKENISFFENKGLEAKDLINLTNEDPFVITLTNERKNAFEEIYYNKLKVTKEEMRKLLSGNNHIYTASPIELDKIIDFLSKKYSMEEIKNILLTYPQIISKKLDDLINHR